MPHYDWLRRELEAVRTPKFHMVAPARPVSPSGLALPRSYEQFVAELGDARLFRMADHYLLGVYAEPQPGASRVGEPLLCIGHHDSARAYFRARELRPGAEPPVLEWGAALREAAPRFDKWIEKRVRTCRRAYRRSEWEKIVRGPRPFSAAELAVVQARTRWRWRVVERKEDSTVRFEVHNGSDSVLSYISIGVRAENLRGKVFLATGSIRPGSTGFCERKVYPQADVRSLEFFDPPPPGPEDRDQYWEFRTSAGPDAGGPATR